MHVAGDTWLQVIRDGLPKRFINNTVPLRSGTAVHVLFFARHFFVSMETGKVSGK